MYKYALELDTIIEILIKYYNIIIRKQYYSKHWLKVLDIILDKGKVLVIGRLRTIQLIKADLQVIIRVFLGLRNIRSIKKDNHISKFNYRLRKGYNIKEVILEKWL